MGPVRMMTAIRLISLPAGGSGRQDRHRSRPAFSDQHDRRHALDRRRKTPVLGQPEAMLLGAKPGKPPVGSPPVAMTRSYPAERSHRPTPPGISSRENRRSATRSFFR
jgi:hypothetical protein